MNARLDSQYYHLKLQKKLTKFTRAIEWDQLPIFDKKDNDVITGGVADNTINGMEGNDLIFGNGGNDTINGGAGYDKIDGGDGKDTIVGGTGNDSINGGEDDDIINGGAGNDTIDGGNGNDTINGRNDNDTIDAGTGSDKLYGGSGKDIFNYEAINDSLFTSPDTIMDFETGIDKIDISLLSKISNSFFHINCVNSFSDKKMKCLSIMIKHKI